MSGRPVLLLDLDDCLCPLKELLREALRESLGTDIPTELWTDYDLGSLYGADFGRLREAFLDGRILERARLLPEAAGLASDARSRGWSVAVVTARDWHPRGREISLAQLEEAGVAHDELIVLAHGVPKAAAVGHLRARAALDDHPGHLDGYAASGLRGPLLLMDQPWNRTDRTHERVGSLAGARARLFGARIP